MSFIKRNRHRNVKNIKLGEKYIKMAITYNVYLEDILKQKHDEK